MLHTAWARALSAIVIVCPHKIKYCFVVNTNVDRGGVMFVKQTQVSVGLIDLESGERFFLGTF